MQVKLKPGAEEFIKRMIGSGLDGISPAASDREISQVIHWTLANLPKLLEATDYIDNDRYFGIKGDSECKPVAIIEVE